MNVVRLGEFAWSTLEPAEGRFDFAWLDEAIELSARYGMKVVLGTPTAAPPAWLTSAYPETLRVDEDGRPVDHGNRVHFNFTNERYRQFARRIAEQMAARYGRNPHVIAWQIDNEIGPPSFDTGSKAKFHEWLRAKYGTVAAMNRAWTTAYWSQTYDRFEQVPMRSTRQNPGLLLDWKRFVSDTWQSYVQNQVDAIRTHADASQPMTTNTMHWNAGFDHYGLHRAVDFASWDCYIPNGRFDWLDNAVKHDLVRGYKRKNFWIMETQTNYVNWWTTNRALDPGQVRGMAWQAVGRGADALLYWQLRSALNGQEQYHGTLLGADGEPVPAYREVQQAGADFEKAAPLLAGTTPVSKVAMLQSYDSRWAVTFQPHHKDYDYVEAFDSFYRPLRLGAQAIDVVSTDAPLDGYRLVVAPTLNVLSQEQAQRLADYVRGGGHLVLGPRSGMKDPTNSLWAQRQPGPLAELLGARVDQYYAIDAPVSLSGEAGAGQATIWAEALSDPVADAKVLMRYQAVNQWMDGRPALVSRTVGKGKITYLGAWVDSELMRELVAQWLQEAKVQPIIAGLSPDVEVSERVGDEQRAWIVINHGTTPQTVHLPKRARNVLTGAAVTNSIQLAARDVAVLEVSR